MLWKKTKEKRGGGTEWNQGLNGKAGQGSLGGGVLASSNKRVKLKKGVKYPNKGEQPPQNHALGHDQELAQH